MKVNIPEFKKLIKKATLNFTIDSVKLEVWKDKISSKMIKPIYKDAITIISVPNTAFINIDDEYDFNFSEPATEVIPYVNLIDDNEADVKVKDNKLVINSGNQRSTIHFCSPNILSVFSVDKPRNEDPFIEIPVDETFLEAFSKIKKVGSKFKKIYFGVDNGNFYIETTDKNNKYANNVRFNIAEIQYQDLDILLDYSNVVNLFNVLDKEKDYKLLFTYLPDKDLGMLHASNEGDEDDREDYYLMSMM